MDVGASPLIPGPRDWALSLVETVGLYTASVQAKLFSVRCQPSTTCLPVGTYIKYKSGLTVCLYSTPEHLPEVFHTLAPYTVVQAAL